MNEGSKLEEIIENIMHLVQGEKVLDVGTGFGTVITKLFDYRMKDITSIDPEAWSFKEIENEFRGQIASGALRLLRSGVEEMPFGNNSFDTTLAICSLHHVNDTVRGIREMERVTSGRIIITDWDPTSSGIYNPHSPEDLQEVKDSIYGHASGNGYNFEEKGRWYLAWK